MYERTRTLIERLLEKTKANALRWEKNPKSNFQTSFPKYTVELSEDSLDDYWMYIYNEEGDLIETVSDLALRIASTRISAKLSEWYQMARRSALGSDEAIEELISALED